MKKVPHEITLLAFTRNGDGTLSVVDIVETSNKFASRLWRQLSRYPETVAIEVCAPSARAGRRVEVRT